MRRGDLVIVALPGDYGKARPSLIIQSDLFLQTDSRTVLPLTTFDAGISVFRIAVDPTPENGLRERSYIMIDKAHTMMAGKVGAVCGRVEDRTMLEVTRSLAVFLGVGE
jgi:mRNA interferase MazF